MKKTLVLVGLALGGLLASCKAGSVVSSSESSTTPLSGSSTSATSTFSLLTVSDPYGFLRQGDDAIPGSNVLGPVGFYQSRAEVETLLARFQDDIYKQSLAFLQDFFAPFDATFFASHDLAAGPYIHSSSESQISFGPALTVEAADLLVAVRTWRPEMYDMDEKGTWFAYQTPKDETLAEKKILLKVHNLNGDVDVPYHN
jgi:hypothetical protein